MNDIVTVHSVTATDGVELSVRRFSSETETSSPRPVVVAVHGYPDNSEVWTPVAERLVEVFDVVAYDVRGAGRSQAPTSEAGYDLDRLVDDVNTIVSWAGTDGAPVHLLAHDWGSIQTWQAVTGTGAASRVASYTSISGPCLDHVERWMRKAARRGSGLRRVALRQGLSSSYIPFFKTPRLPELAIRSGAFAATIERGTRKSGSAYHRSERDYLNGLNLYRRNMLTRRHQGTSGESARTTSVPVQIIAAERDPYVTVPLATCATAFVPDVTVTPVDAGHWVVASHAGWVADAVTRFAENVSRR